jgi:hypothetical protein
MWRVLRLGRGCLLVASVLLAWAAWPAPPAQADTWCEVDPAVVVTTPAGNTVVVYVVNGGPLEHALQLAAPTISHTVAPLAGGAATQVKLSVLVADPDGHAHPVQSQAWSGPAMTGTLYASASGAAGKALQLTFRVEVP